MPQEISTLPSVATKEHYTDAHARAIKDVIPQTRQAIRNLKAAVEDAPSLTGRWKNEALQQLKGAESKLDEAERHPTPHEAVRLFKNGMADFSMAANSLADQMKDSETQFRALKLTVTVIAVSAAVTEVALFAKGVITYQASQSLATSLTAPLANLSEMVEATKDASLVSRFNSLKVALTGYSSEVGTGMAGSVALSKLNYYFDSFGNALTKYAEKIGSPIGTIKVVDRQLDVIKELLSK